MSEFDWSFAIWSIAVFVAGYLLAARIHSSPTAPLDFDRSTISSGARQQIEQALGRDAKIEAIKILRADTGLGLKDAKAVIDTWESSSGS
ncbi:ribosomal protein L7/L12 [Erythrobacter sp. JK5]|uniref:ribosomal protein L7/L12 n=1 Tax=Erythrobacter sp. JK5 TaxID=2829500 RepID=UPI001BA85499|nr:ribosomal protein L7/L12 [Erythrobacter sp. JK5]QUL37411.1 ribosomal protein L7/L12 [Erythrobacter sp. JK5]